MLTSPTMGGITAPPEMAIMSNPEISLALSLIRFREIEKIIGNIFPAPRPVMKMNIIAAIYAGDKKIPIMPIIATSEVIKRKGRGFIQFRIIAPNSRDTVSPAKKTLIPITAVSSGRENLPERIFAMFVLMATSAPTIRNIERAIITTNLFLNKPKQELNVAG